MTPSESRTGEAREALIAQVAQAISVSKGHDPKATIYDGRRPSGERWVPHSALWRSEAKIAVDLILGTPPPAGEGGEALRKRFETWARQAFSGRDIFGRYNGIYAKTGIEMAWMAWCAALQADTGEGGKGLAADLASRSHACAAAATRYASDSADRTRLTGKASAYAHAAELALSAQPLRSGERS